MFVYTVRSRAGLTPGSAAQGVSAAFLPYKGIMNTVFALLDAAATIYFARQFGAASIGERLLIESVVY